MYTNVRNSPDAENHEQVIDFAEFGRIPEKKTEKNMQEWRYESIK